ncbi:MAG: hypothetical protein ACO1QB_18655 [Verrucomicrobiales bacterium]
MPHLTSDQILLLAAELNHVLWTPDSPAIPTQLIGLPINLPEGNMQCIAHVVVCSAILKARGATVTSRAGAAYAVEPQKQDAFRILKHWWLSTERGLVDLSINLFGFSEVNPVIFENDDYRKCWSLVFTDDITSVEKRVKGALGSQIRTMIYYTKVKRLVTPQLISKDLFETFGPSRTIAPFTYAALVNHCESVLEGAMSLRSIPQTEAWRVLSKNNRKPYDN